MRLLKKDFSKSKFTRKCIGEAVVSLLKNTELKQLKVLTVVQKAGFSRMTFYKYYSSPRAALEDYLNIIISEYLISDQSEDAKVYLTYDHILSALLFFDQYRDFFLVMRAHGLYDILINSVNAFLEEHMAIREDISIYKRYAYAGGFLNCFLLWEESNKKDSAQDVARTIYQLYGTP